ncbi:MULTISPECIES: sirohydrochlorin chelatase [Mycolicibacterium]|uniref:Sirohydrochlorin chelatase n=1 Tax=Mycolicibacterium mageritense TaxID=53462 RepID=A0AAI8U2H7_MYCME|nr:sirohydrochlorin chelatase [Mycolicibacterium mageritense]MBN3453848.1 sirohydrochlorin chelatase [Mycobacterium sp. DSM 3803]OKH78310.1 sirohydrochlorin ferrochelatase [Mycobacterium sp. SWH-M3]MCC9182740.1 sirohydrochlorin chelatase [Mycolicibacterium mageritense]TXI60388.1 MAG: sirohydrochlorin chelatase [Mycolicibacterium mageritense]CDO26980.1 cobalamin (vitamin B12) biosynthesis CbiX protein [Mycolicibacterium mageritense DSM 44476 = CIP 104973]
MRVARLVNSLVLTAHGSADPRSAANAHAIAGHLRRLLPDTDVRVAFCEQNTPNLVDALADVAPGSVVTPLLLASAYHARTDIPAIITEAGADVRQADVLGEDPRLLQVVRERLTAIGVSRFDADLGVILASVGSSHPVANARTAALAHTLAEGTRWVGVEAGFATGQTPSVAEAAARLRASGARRLVIAPWFLAHGKITDRVAEFARTSGIPMAEPLGPHRLVAATVLDRYEEALAARTAGFAA